MDVSAIADQLLSQLQQNTTPVLIRNSNKLRLQVGDTTVEFELVPQRDRGRRDIS